MKTIVVTSSVTYTPENYIEFTSILAKHPSVVGLVILNNFNLGLLKTVLGLFAMGANNMATQMVRNIISNSQRAKEQAYLELGKWAIRLDSLNSQEFVTLAESCDLILHSRTRSFLKPEVLAAPRLGCVNVHHGVLPKQRGVLCDLQAIAQQVEGLVPGFSLHEMTSVLDGGQIFHVEQRPTQHLDFMRYLSEGARLEAAVVSEFLSRVESFGHLPEGQPNSKTGAVMWKNPSPADLKRWKLNGLKI